MGVEVMADKFIVIVDESKLCGGLGPGFPVPVEITPFCHEHTLRTVAALPSCAGCKPVLRMGSSSSNQVDGDEMLSLIMETTSLICTLKKQSRMLLKWLRK